jgi:hypothetical protein
MEANGRYGTLAHSGAQSRWCPQLTGFQHFEFSIVLVLLLFFGERRIFYA